MTMGVPRFGEKLGFDMDDGTGLRVAHARFLDEKQFDWNLFAGYDQLRVLTYSASVKAIVRMLDQFAFNSFECVFGYEGTLRETHCIGSVCFNIEPWGPVDTRSVDYGYSVRANSRGTCIDSWYHGTSAHMMDGWDGKRYYAFTSNREYVSGC